LVLAQPATATSGPEDEAQKAAEAWLALIESGKYNASWEEAAELLKQAVTKEDWNRTIEGARRPFGKLLSRTVKSRTYAETLPGAPDGKYVIIQFETSFEKKSAAVETITPVMGPDNAWRVSGYYIK
jgi:hypothetical protein